MSNYFILCGKLNGMWEFIFGDYKKSVVVYEKNDQKESYLNWEKLKIIPTSDKQESINKVIKSLNSGANEMKNYSAIEGALNGVRGLKWLVDDKSSSERIQIYEACNDAIEELEENLENKVDIDDALITLEALLDEVAGNHDAYKKITEVYAKLEKINN